MTYRSHAEEIADIRKNYATGHLLFLNLKKPVKKMLPCQKTECEFYSECDHAKEHEDDAACHWKHDECGECKEVKNQKEEKPCVIL